jgi:hypothetical protein
MDVSLRGEREVGSLLGDLEEVGYASLGPFEYEYVEWAEWHPWEFVESELGVRAARVDVARVEPVPGATSFASTAGEAQLHTDITMSVVPPHIELFLCRRPAESGGTSLLFDSWPFVRVLEHSSPELFDSLFTQIAEKAFVLKWAGPTLGLRHGNLVFVHSPIQADERPEERELIGRMDEAAATDATRLDLDVGEGVIFSNHRVLHGRTAFEDPTRSLLRMHIWLCEPWTAPPDLWRRVAEAAEMFRAVDAARAGFELEDLGLDEPPSSEALFRAGVVQETLGRSETIIDKVAERLGLSSREIRCWLGEAMESLTRSLDYF